MRQAASSRPDISPGAIPAQTQASRTSVSVFRLSVRPGAGLYILRVLDRGRRRGRWYHHCRTMAPAGLASVERS